MHFVDDCFYQDNYGKKLGIAFKGLMGDLTVNLGVLNYKDGYASLVVDMRVPHEMTDEQLTMPIVQQLNKYGLEETHELGKAIY